MTSVSKIVESCSFISVDAVSSSPTRDIAFSFGHNTALTVGRNEFALNVVTYIIGVRK